MHPPTLDVEAGAFRLGAKTEWSTNTVAMKLLHQVFHEVHIEDGDSN